LFIGTDVPEKKPNLTDEALLLDAETGEPFLFYAPYPGDVSQLRNALLAQRYQASILRAGAGIRQLGATFGYTPRQTVRKRDTCRVAAFNLDHPETASVLTDTARVLDEQLRSIVPEARSVSAETASAIHPDWRIHDDSFWTSGVVNKTATLPYHRDRNNFDVWSSMPVLRRHAEGGFLDLPEYDLTLGCRDGWVIAFPGYSLVHGVTPIRLERPDGYRYSIVYYALRGMKDCLTTAAEQARGRRVRSQREDSIGAEVRSRT
jgi:hypothetical protein